MDESFKARVEKVFGSLAASRSPSVRSPSCSSSSLWSISDGEVERREWRRCADTSGRDETPCSSSFDEFLKKDWRLPRRRDFDEDLDEDRERIGAERDENGAAQDEWGIRSFIGMDRTLDYEEEEDEFDKVASGRENAGDRLYMSDVTEKGSFLNSDNVLGNKKDPRANHLAAKHRLKEDEAEAQKFAEIKEPADAKGSKDKAEAQNFAEIKEPADAKGSKDEARPKPILKRKDNESVFKVFKPQKRVRFDVECKNDGEETSPNEVVFKASGLPDYLVNPSKYTCYSLESTTEVDEFSNARACGDFLNEVKNIQNEFSNGLPKSVTFIPKKKASDAKVVNEGHEVEQNKESEGRKSLHPEGFAVGIAAGEVEVETSGVEDDEPETKAAANTGFQKPGRRYRTMANSYDSDT
ncbi:hypothetical protein L484_013146 [Morus notabilis]|uniref:Uncharacterized protein n=1 Tax=Morus notabilis TaxID=981085 RepID=W9S0J4_9ROSA|nr:uncharacterized protein LOC21396330 [Morus notabilis]EXB81205.1 hypothetical protein L484_013146 [Morus notabilis]